MDAVYLYYGTKAFMGDSSAYVDTANPAPETGAFMADLISDLNFPYLLPGPKENQFQKEKEMSSTN